MNSSIIFSHILNIYDVLLLTTFVVALLLAIPLLIKRDRGINDVLLAAFIFIQGFYAFYSVLLFNENIGQHIRDTLFPFYKVPHLLVLGLQGLLVLWFARAMMGRSLGLRSKTTNVVAILCLITIVVNLHFNIASGGNIHVLLACAWLLNVCSVVLGFEAIRQLHSYEIKLPFIHSTIDKYSLTWLKVVMIGFVSVWVLPVVADFSMVVGLTNFAEILYLFRHVPPLFLISTMVLYSQSHAISQSQSLEISAEKKQPENSTIVNPNSINQLNDLMQRVKLYQDPELRLDGLADSMGISPRSLSSILNQHYQKSFYDFVNQYRISDAIEQLREKSKHHKTIQRVFEEAGFNSKTTFNTLFKKSTGKTPSEFRESVKEEVVN
ncbi:AraC family transcriptional regulator [Aliiglaciecola sp. M165]|uniref:AraC family transcriptional regulator n=1 Tax=Aliiglaciecola sp. M165 TaxID=2593649 RepID=UPI00117D4B50|nr:helix-turn-helix domain-containing protein [Aliiglaciecola sp. M165]TRY30094.1 AraC family transcriptional regulator [Aliiglaciecola sp. M165]